MGEAGPPARPTATSPQAIATPYLEPRTNNRRKQKSAIFSVFAPRTPPPGLPERPGDASSSVHSATSLIAQ